MTRSDTGSAITKALVTHWTEYLIEAAALGVFMLAACAFGAAIEYPGSPVRQAVDDSFTRRVPMGIAMGLTAVTIVCSPWGQRSGAHLNPAITLTFWRLGKVAPWDALFYCAAQLVGGALGVVIAVGLLGPWLSDPAVNYVATVPGPAGTVVALVAETLISFGLMTVILAVSNSRFAQFTPQCAGALIALYIVTEAPLSGMSMNPARSLGSALFAGTWPSLWVYGVGPLLGMMLAALAYTRVRSAEAVRCAKLHHRNRQPCPFICHQSPVMA
ncbi:MAG: aquaporin [Chloroflexota bacterium]